MYRRMEKVRDDSFGFEAVVRSRPLTHAFQKPQLTIRLCQVKPANSTITIRDSRRQNHL
jgi:hypothetical protein